MTVATATTAKGAHIAYFRVSTLDQSIDSQRAALTSGGLTFAKEFTDQGVSGGVQAVDRPAFAEMLKYVREGDTIHVYAVDRLGRDAIDVQTTVRALIKRGVSVNVRGLGVIAEGVGELILAVLAQVAEMEKRRINERTAAGREVARKALAETGRTQHGKTSLGRPTVQDAAAVLAWKAANEASIDATAKHFGIGTSTVKRYMRAA